MKDLLFSLCNAPALGCVEQAFEVAEAFLAPFATVRREPGSLVAEIPGNGEPLLLEAHLDEVGFTVTHVQQNGFLTVSPVGSVDSRILPGIPVQVLGQKKLPGVFTSVPPHLAGGEKVAGFDDLKIDIGPENVPFVSVGDLAVYSAPATALLGTAVTSKALDDRSGVAAVLWAAQKIAKTAEHRAVTLLFTNGEELGCRGAKTAAFALQNKVAAAVSVDVSFGNFPGCDPLHTAVLGSGVMIGVSPVLDKPLTATLKALAEAENIPFTQEIMAGNTSTNADVIAVTGAGIPAALLSIPLRNMHTPCEVADLRDITAVADLLTALCVKGDF